MGGYSASYMITIRLDKDKRDRLDRLCLLYSQSDIFEAGLNAIETREADKLAKERGEIK